jgi:O-antigen ligase
VSHLLRPLLVFQRFFIPALLILLVWAIWRTVFRKDTAVGLALYVTLLIVVDGFYNTGLYLPGLEKGSIRYSEICAMFLLLNRAPPLPPDRLRKGIGWLIAGYFILMLIAALRAEPMLSGIFDFRRIVFPQILSLVLGLRAFRTPEEYRRFLLALTVPILIIALFSFWDIFFQRWLLHSDMLYTPEYFANRRAGRSGSLLLNPNYLGALVVLTFPPLFVLALTEQVRRARISIGVVLLALIFCLVETQSRAPVAAFAVAVLLLVLGPAGRISRRRRLAGLAGTILVFATFMPGFLQHASERFGAQGYEESEEVVSRPSVWRYTQRIIAEHPLLGIGLGESQFLAAMDQTDFATRYGRSSLDNPHNSYLQAAVYAGVPSVMLLVAANLLVLWKGTRIAWSDASRSTQSGAIFGLTVSLTGFLICIYPDMHLFTQNVAPVYWLLFGWLLALISLSGRESVAQVRASPRPRPGVQRLLHRARPLWETRPLKS